MPIPELSIIVAMSENRVIGKNNQLPWHLPEDLKHFKKTTLGQPIIMGRKTFESIGRPLPGRANLVLTRQIGWSTGGVEVVESLERGVEKAQTLLREKERREIFVIGGAEIYRQALPLTSRLYVTLVHRKIDGDAYFPEISAGEWQEKSRSEIFHSEKCNVDYSFVNYQRRAEF